MANCLGEGKHWIKAICSPNERTALPDDSYRKHATYVPPQQPNQITGLIN